MLVGTILIVCLMIYGLTRKIFRAYVYFISREERHLRRDHEKRLGLRPTTGIVVQQAHHHLGPKFFLALDVILLATSVHCLGRLINLDSDIPSIDRVVGPFALFSILATLCTIRMGRDIGFYYTELAHAVRGERGISGVFETIPSAAEPVDVSSHRTGRMLRRLALLWAALPLIAYLMGREEWILPHDSVARTLSAFAIWFVAPQLMLAIAILRDVVPIRRGVYGG